MTDDLIAYLMDDLSPERRAEVDAKLQSDVVWRWELDRLRECMAASDDVAPFSESPAAASEPVESSHVDLEPPVDLVKKTCCFVEDSASGKYQVQKKPCKKKTAFSAAACESRGRSWSLADVTVGAGVLLILAALIMPAVQQSRDTARENFCANNMKAIFAGFEHSPNRRGNLLPTLAASEPNAMRFVDLIDSGIITPAEAAQIVTCPNSPQAQRKSQAGVVVRFPNREELKSLSAPELAKVIDQMFISYAMQLGYRDAAGEYQQPTLNGDYDEPLVSDAPAVTMAGLQAVNHGCRQNVLKKSGSVNPMSASVLGGADESLKQLHLNDIGELAAGCDENDIVLAPAYCTADGPLTPMAPRTMKPILIIQFGPPTLLKQN